ncbi:MAG: hypothetical protein NXI20_03280 [bacterium]|nr:hypothetical protein [bacterium]
MILNFDIIRQDIEAFADDTSDVAIDRITGQILFARGGKDYEFTVLKKEDHIKNVMYNNTEIPYLTFLTKHVANLDSLAERIVAKRPPVQAYTDGPAVLETPLSGEIRDKSAIKLLDDECKEKDTFSSKIIFITADAGHGKTALLREYQFKQAQNYLQGNTDFLFWHIDLQGRQLLRLSEAFMGDLGELRISGLWWQSIIRLIKHGKLIIGIDGFDELAVEQGSNDALGALSLIVNQMENSGTLVAASRRTFFDTEDYLKRSRLIEGKLNNLCHFDQINLEDWDRETAILYLINRGFESPEELFDEICSHLGRQENHPILTRPFLLSQIAGAIITYGISASEFIGGMTNPEDPHKGVNSIIEAFVKREVDEKWKSKETGQPYLSKDQHIEILSAVAEEMWKNQRDRLAIEIIETLTVILLDQWQIEDKDLRLQVFEMVRMHALLVIPIDGDNNYRKFEHPQFKDYFTARSLDLLINTAHSNSFTKPLTNFLSIAQISDSLALYTFSNTNLSNKDVKDVLNMLEDMVLSEWKPTFLHINVGTLLPYILRDYDLSEMLEFKSKVIYSSLIFENKQFRNFEIHNGTFLNTSFRGSSFENIKLINCELDEVCIGSNTSFKNVQFIDCEFNGLKLGDNDDSAIIEFAPIRVQQKFKELGIEVINTSMKLEFESVKEPHRHSKAIHRFLRSMRRTTFISKNNIETILRSDKNFIIDELIPLMEKHDLLEYRKDKGDVWSLRTSYQDMSRAEFEDGNTSCHKFWKELEKKN